MVSPPSKILSPGRIDGVDNQRRGLRQSWFRVTFAPTIDIDFKAKKLKSFGLKITW